MIPLEQATRQEGTSYIYALKDPRTNDVRYIGQSICPKKRYYAYTASYGVGKKVTAWVRRLKKKNLLPVMVIVERVQKEQADERELFWMAHYRRRFDLLNVGHTHHSTKTLKVKIPTSLYKRAHSKERDTGIDLSALIRRALALWASGEWTPFAQPESTTRETYYKETDDDR